MTSVSPLPGAGGKTHATGPNPEGAVSRTAWHDALDQAYGSASSVEQPDGSQGGGQGHTDGHTNGTRQRRDNPQAHTITGAHDRKRQDHGRSDIVKNDSKSEHTGRGPAESRQSHPGNDGTADAAGSASRSRNTSSRIEAVGWKGRGGASVRRSTDKRESPSYSQTPSAVSASPASGARALPEPSVTRNSASAHHGAEKRRPQSHVHGPSLVATPPAGESQAADAAQRTIRGSESQESGGASAQAGRSTSSDPSLRSNRLTKTKHHRGFSTGGVSVASGVSFGPAHGTTRSPAQQTSHVSQNVSAVGAVTNSASFASGKVVQTPPSSPESPAVPQQIATTVVGLAQEAGSSARIHLHPAALGEVTINVQVTHAGVVNVHMTASQPAGAQALSGGAQSLAQHLAQAGFTPGSIHTAMQAPAGHAPPAHSGGGAQGGAGQNSRGQNGGQEQPAPRQPPGQAEQDETVTAYA